MPSPSTPFRAARICIALAMLQLAGCATTEPASFDSPQSAVDSLVAALRVNDQKELKRVLGSDSDQLLNSGDEVADANGRAEFLRLYDEKHNLKPETAPYADSAPLDNEVMTLEVGSTDWPMPIPVAKDDQGWFFNTAAGLDEVLSRRIGRNELSTIQVCLAIVDAQREYASTDINGDGLLEYARKVNSDPGQKNGLYWPVAAGGGDKESPLGELVAKATAEGYTQQEIGDPPRPYHGYYYRLLSEQGPAAPGGAMNFVVQNHMIGGFGVVAWPASYGNSGIKTFIVSHHGVVYERDLGESTARIAKSMRAFNPEAGWEVSDTTQQLQPADGE